MPCFAAVHASGFGTSETSRRDPAKSALLARADEAIASACLLLPLPSAAHGTKRTSRGKAAMSAFGAKWTRISRWVSSAAVGPTPASILLLDVDCIGLMTQ